MAFVDVVSILYSVEEAKRKFKNLKDTHTRFYRMYQKETKKGNNGIVEEPKWKWWPHFAFIRGEAQPVLK